ncbi:hypothetical protein BV22DRAFT_243680 [Leucogyrophana mollusca]|uniref:Uncharacterized protein n=1 Tax=Leucogyrophana mollusca TaxID=85980 RepID=A0ACB8BSD3_9AGAM|nr:hypothetical protein BV22DRAFT_243680 [Leucogyrophana mollusca]
MMYFILGGSPSGLISPRVRWPVTDQISTEAGEALPMKPMVLETGLVDEHKPRYRSTFNVQPSPVSKVCKETEPYQLQQALLSTMSIANASIGPMRLELLYSHDVLLSHRECSRLSSLRLSQRLLWLPKFVEYLFMLSCLSVCIGGTNFMRGDDGNKRDGGWRHEQDRTMLFAM